MRSANPSTKRTIKSRNPDAILRAAVIEPLESRAYLSFGTDPSIALVGTTIVALGTTAADTAEITASGSQITVQIDSDMQSFAASSVTTVNLTTGPGDDTITIGSGLPALFVNGNGGRDMITDSNNAADTIFGGAGGDSIIGGGGSQSLDGGGANDTIVAGSGSDNINGEGGNDSITGGATGSIMVGSDGNDTIVAGTGNDTIAGEAGDDSLIGGPGTDLLKANSNLGGSTDGDTLIAGTGNNTLRANVGSHDSLVGAGGGNDKLIGKIGNDTLIGDTTSGGAGIDTLVGGTGQDVLTGGPHDSIMPGSLTSLGQFGSDTPGGGLYTNDTITGGANPVITYTLSINDNGSGVYVPGDFAIYATDNANNGGISGVAVDVSGATSVTNVLPRGTYDNGQGNGGFVEEGFTLFPSPNGNPSSPQVLPIGGTQDYVSVLGTPVLIYGLGQRAGNLASDAPAGSTGPGGTIATVQPVYGTPLLVAKGTFSGSIAYASSDNFQGGVFVSNGATTLEDSPSPVLIFNTQTIPTP